MDGEFFTTETFDSLELGLELDDMVGGSADLERLRWIELEESPVFWSVSSCSGTKIVEVPSLDREIESPAF